MLILFPFRCVADVLVPADAFVADAIVVVVVVAVAASVVDLAHIVADVADVD